jgi:hypothetical protein
VVAAVVVLVFAASVSTAVCALPKLAPFFVHA